MNNLDSFLKNFKIKKKEIFEYLFMQYSYYANKNNENDLIRDSYFANSNQELNNSSDILNYLIKKDKINNKNIVKYIQLFIKNNF